MKRGLARFLVGIIVISFVAAFTIGANKCDGQSKSKPVADSGAKKVSAKVKTGAKGMTVEQAQVKRRIELENTPGSIKHLYIISAYSGQVILYSTVQGKVTSSNKSLTAPVYLKKGDRGSGTGHFVFPRIGDDGTYKGGSAAIGYIYWWDVRDIYHQHYITGGQIPHISDQPLPGIKNIVVNFENVTKSE